MKTPIPAITTHYGGRKYRSRTEAKWAVFFDVAGIRFDYEIDGFVVGDGAYLPDFFVRTFDMWLEVKGVDPTEVERRKCADLVRLTGKDCLLAVGAPEERFQIHWFDRDGERDCLFVIAQDHIVDCGFWLVGEDESFLIGTGVSIYGVSKGPMFDGALNAAYAAAHEEKFTRADSAVRRLPEPHRPERTGAGYYSDEDVA